MTRAKTKNNKGFTPGNIDNIIDNVNNVCYKSSSYISCTAEFYP